MALTTEHLQHFADHFIGRKSDYALQLPTGRYRRTGFPITLDVIEAHLTGSCTIGTYS